MIFAWVLFVAGLVMGIPLGVFLFIIYLDHEDRKYGGKN